MNEKTNAAMEKNLKSYRAALQRVRSDRDLSEEARRRMMGETFSQAAAAHARLVEEDRAAVAEAYDGAIRRVFSPPMRREATAADMAAIQASHRDAMFRASAVGAEDTEGLTRIQEMASASGDQSLLRAALYRAHEVGAESVVRAVTESDPEIARAWETLKAAGDELHAAESDPMRYGGTQPDRPPELDGVPPAAAAG